MSLTRRTRTALGFCVTIIVAATASLALVGTQRSDAGAVLPPDGGLATATFAGGCFWCMEPPFDELDGVVSTTSGYIGGDTINPTYQAVSSGRTGHTEAVEVLYDPERISYGQLLEVFWRNVDPLTANGQFCDFGSQYRTGIFFHTPEQERLARESKARLDRSPRFSDPIVTEITEAGAFYAAEEYHQDYYQKNPIRYKFYRYGCGRDARLEALWGDTN
jgi:peptide-methionine (S)-S-oxide reductase